MKNAEMFGPLMGEIWEHETMGLVKIIQSGKRECQVELCVSKARRRACVAKLRRITREVEHA